MVIRPVTNGKSKINTLISLISVYVLNFYVCLWGRKSNSSCVSTQHNTANRCSAIGGEYFDLWHTALEFMCHWRIMAVILSAACPPGTMFITPPVLLHAGKSGECCTSSNIQRFISPWCQRQSHLFSPHRRQSDIQDETWWTTWSFSFQWDRVQCSESGTIDVWLGRKVEENTARDSFLSCCHRNMLLPASFWHV